MVVAAGRGLDWAERLVLVWFYGDLMKNFPKKAMMKTFKASSFNGVTGLRVREGKSSKLGERISGIVVALRGENAVEEKLAIALMAARILTKDEYREDPSRKLTFTEVRKSLVGDVTLLCKVFLFLESCSLINYGATVGGSGGGAEKEEEERCKGFVLRKVRLMGFVLWPRRTR